jgi:hypothetical protein
MTKTHNRNLQLWMGRFGAWLMLEKGYSYVAANPPTHVCSRVVVRPHLSLCVCVCVCGGLGVC